MLSVHQRGFEPKVRSGAGLGKEDFIVGHHNRSAIGTLVERQTRYVKLLHLPAFNSIEMHAALVRRLSCNDCWSIRRRNCSVIKRRRQHLAWMLLAHILASIGDYPYR